ncbi:MAG: sigma 54-interacting transcriptional regulator [Deltaproteobacteria bacterium]|nr:sigma 54-interacting transcriptional regulator [Deltaproteobacteria bacterium]MBW2120399.1 sigma 54-interacting transcriptional regulator [Deltaproteobacteria bacterium]
MKIEERERFFNLILDSIADGVFTINAEWEITSFNRAAEEITGFKAREAIGKYCFDVFRASICQTQCALRETMKTRKEITNRTVNILTKEGRELPIRISTAVLRNRQGEIIGGVETFRDLTPIETLRKELARKVSFHDIISQNHRMQEFFAILPDIAESDSTVLIQGPSGSGKELFARAIHNMSHRKNQSFIAVNCGALPDSLLESELFGYVRGAFTDARRDKPGRFALAHRGTILLDEIGEMSQALQTKLLRVIEEKSFEPLGATSPKPADVRIVAATNRDLERLVESGRFREDLFYRINVIKIELPPLRERREDIPLLVDHFIRSFNLKRGRSVEGVSHEVMEVLLKYDFPGNVRELENIIEHAFILRKEGLIGLKDLPAEILRKADILSAAEPGTSLLTRSEVEAIRRALQRHGGNRMEAARELGIDRTTLWRKMKRYGL